jgi:glycosyltransferase involved in cell wall biosynthesis
MPMRVLMVIAPTLGTEQPTVWAGRQIESLKALGVAVETYVFRNRRSLLGLLGGGLALRRKARECGADLVHVHYGAAQGFIAVLLVNKPVVISFCGSDLLGNYDLRGHKTWSGRLSGFLSRLGAIGCRRAIAKSEELRQALWLRPLRNKCDVIPNGVDLNQFHPMPQATARAALGWNHDDPVVLFMDRKGAWVKDPALAHAAYSEAKKKVGNLRLNVVENVCPDKMPLFYNAADALLLTSHHEGSNNTTKEALACNLPIVATACGDVRERLAGVQGCYVCSRNHQELGRKLSLVVTRRERSEGRQHVQDLTVDRIGMRIKHVYETVLRNRRKTDCVTAQAR